MKCCEKLEMQRTSEITNSENKELRAIKLGRGDVVLGIAAGGTTPYVLGGLEYLNRMMPAAARPKSGPDGRVPQ